MESNSKISTKSSHREALATSSVFTSGRQRRRKDRRSRSLPSAKRQERRRIAAAHIEKLIELALSEARRNPKLATRYADLAWGISTRFNVRLKEKRNYFCRSCKTFLALPDTARYRLSNKRRSLNITCVRCGYTYRKIIVGKDVRRAING